MTASARPKARDTSTRDMLIAATSQVMVEEGYAAATSRRVAAQAGVTLDLRPFVPVVEGVLMTGGTPRYLRGRPTSPDSPAESVFTEVLRGSAPPKIAARYLGPHLLDQGPATVAASS